MAFVAQLVAISFGCSDIVGQHKMFRYIQRKQTSI